MNDIALVLAAAEKYFGVKFSRSDKSPFELMNARATWAFALRVYKGERVDCRRCMPTTDTFGLDSM
jgi:hypothetical protein